VCCLETSVGNVTVGEVRKIQSGKLHHRRNLPGEGGANALPMLFLPNNTIYLTTELKRDK
jgi:hypothetical protein